ncbi:hypothetical protein [Azospirillum soli]|uniref:hypothetical protein n=1 Tax=Azospirillum soli TaxID=1304799 RepID=UPI001AE8696C|nr:hypothetical protein [Azospirillum soli]MBP2314543.1 septal ring factor EnvC (AmiA/AmiB activator) [Azospirillum soli]
MSNTTLLLIAIAMMMLVAVPLAFMLKDFLPRAMLRSSGLEQLENRIYVLHSEAHDLQDRVKGLEQRRNQLSSDKHRVESDNRKMEKAIAELADQSPLFVHEVGTPQAGLTKFIVNVSQEKASAAARASGDRAAVNPIWRCINVAEVWAASLEDAKQLVEVAFPFKMGFEKSFQKTPGTNQPGRPSQAKASAS